MFTNLSRKISRFIVAILPTGAKIFWCKVTKFPSFFPYFFSCFSPPQQDNIDRSTNHRQADLIGPAFQPSANQSSPNHQGWCWATIRCVCVRVCDVCACVCTVQRPACGSFIAGRSGAGGWVSGNSLLYLGLFRYKHFDSSKGDHRRHRVPL